MKLLFFLISRLNRQFKNATLSHFENMKRRFKRGENWRFRCLPGLYIAGVAKSGTSDFYVKLLTTHPDMYNAVAKEPNWWKWGVRK